MTQFTGFSDEGFRFLRALKRNNRRDWFLERKDVYEAEVRAPMEALVSDIGERILTFAPEFVAHPKKSVYRIYRDTRFSHDKTPYKTHIAAIFPHRDLGKHQGAGFYVHVSPEEIFAGGGVYQPGSQDLHSIRLRLADETAEFRRIISGRRFRDMFGSISGEQLQKVPRGFATDHPASDLLRHKQFLAGRSLTPDLARSPKFLTEVVRTFRALHPMCRFLNTAIERGRTDAVEPQPLRRSARRL